MEEKQEFHAFSNNYIICESARIITQPKDFGDTLGLTLLSNPYNKENDPVMYNTYIQKSCYTPQFLECLVKGSSISFSGRIYKLNKYLTKSQDVSISIQVTVDHVGLAKGKSQDSSTEDSENG